MPNYAPGWETEDVGSEIGIQDEIGMWGIIMAS